MVRDNETGNHILRTKQYVETLARRLRATNQYVDELSEDAIRDITQAAPLHDIGKVGIPDAILKKDGALDEDEWTIMKTHAALGEQVLQATMIKDIKHTSVLRAAMQIAGGHHENWDGSGYPRGLKGLNIPLAARIMSLADTYDALISERVYKNAWTHDEACAEICRLKGIRFDPAVVEAFLMDQDRFIHIANTYKDAA
jgi:response regulator RpfG family c-di-GMP phosphodiesterase